MKAPVAGVMEQVAQGVRRCLAPNPLPMTYWGTNSYVLGQGQVCVVDPGPDDPSHIEALLDGLEPGETVVQILVTHAHIDHSPGARLLSARTGAPVLAYGNALAGRSARMAGLSLGGGEGVDTGFAPDICLANGEVIQTSAGEVTALWTPGHFGNHLCFALPDGVVLTGDLVMGWASSLVSPPDGDLTDFMASLDLLLGRSEDQLYLPGHGECVTSPLARVAELRAHRRMRHDQILGALSQAPGTAEQLAARIYTDIDPALLPAAARNVLAHLIDMNAQNLATPAGQLSAEAVFHFSSR